MYRDRCASLEALGKIFAFQYAGDGIFCRKLDHAARAKRIRPFGVVADFGTGRIEHQTRLREVGLCIGLDLLPRQWWPGHVAS